MKQVNVGLIGCGGRLRGVVENVLTANKNVKIVAACDPDERSIKTTKEKFGSDIKVYEDYHDLVKADDIDWVMIGSWNCYHREHTVAAFEAGKDVFCEKPLATNLEDCVAMREAWLQSGRKFVIGFTLRYSAHYEKIKELLENREIGDVISMEFNETLGFNHGGYIMGDWRRLTQNAGTHLLEKCSHDIDLVNWLLESRASRVASFGSLRFFTPENAYHVDRVGKDAQGKDAFQTWPGLISENPFTSDKDIIDNQVAIIQYENGVNAMFHTNCNCAMPERRMYICGSEGTIRANVLTGDIELCKIGHESVVQKIDSGVSGGHGGGDTILGERLAACMMDEREPHTSLDDGFKSAITCFGIDESMEIGQMVDMDVWWKKAGM